MKNFAFCPDGINKCLVTAYLQTGGQSPKLKERKIPAVIICPRGGYKDVFEREGEPVAKEYFAAGYHVFIVNCGRLMAAFLGTLLNEDKFRKVWNRAEHSVVKSSFCF